MWGNKIGWGISVLIVILTVGSLAMFQIFDTPTPPTQAFAADASNLAEIALPTAPSSLVKMEDPCDAGDLYKEAIADYESHQSQYEEFTTSPRDLSDVNALKGVEAVVKATHCKSITLLTRDVAKFISYDSDKPEIDALRVVGKAAVNAGLLAQEANPAEAMKYYEAGFAMGAKLIQERLLYVELLTGIDLILQSSKAIQDLAEKQGDTARSQDMDAFRKAFTEYRDQHLLTTARVITSIDQNVIEENVGNVFLLAQQSKDHLWKTEAVLKLGRYKYNAGRASDQRAARRTLRALAKDESLDPVTKAAAVAAKDLTIEQYRQLH